MTMPSPLDPLTDALSSPRLAHALTQVTFGLALCEAAITRTIGWPGYLGALITLVVLTASALLAQRRTIDWRGVLPVSLLTFGVWAVLSVIWSRYQWATVGGLVYLFVFTVMGLAIAVHRDLGQLVRAAGSALRVTLVASLGLEVLSGALLDVPFRFLRIEGRLGELGPLQGVFGDATQLGIVAVLGLVTFGVEVSAGTVRRTTGIASLLLAGGLLVLSRDPLALVVAVAVGVAALALTVIRRIPPARRTFWQLALLTVAGVVAAFLVLARSPLRAILDGLGILGPRLELWQQVWQLAALRPFDGWGWVGPWRTDVQPFPLLAAADGIVPSGARNAYLDVWLQLGLIGVVVFVGMLGLGLARAWLLAGRQATPWSVWPALVLATLVLASAGDSAIAGGWAWLLFVATAARAARELPWSQAIEPSR